MLNRCLTVVLHNDLQLNRDKSEVVILGTALRSSANIREVKVAGSRLQVAPTLKSLGITIDSHLRFDCHAKKVARACNYHTRALRHVRTVTPLLRVYRNLRVAIISFQDQRSR